MAIKRTDIIEDNHLSNAIDQGEKYIVTVEKMNKAVRKLAATMKEVFEANNVETAKDFDELAKGVEKVKRAKTQQEKINAKLVQSQSALVTAISKENVLIQRNKVATQERNKEIKQQIKLDKVAKGSIEAMDLELKKLITDYSRLSKIQRENQKVGGALSTRIRLLRGELTKLKTGTVNSANSFGALRGDVQKATNTFRNFATAIGLVGGIRLVANIFRDAIGVIKDFDLAITNLGAISGFSADELDPLVEQAKQLGATTRFTASQVADLQLELAKLGFSAGDISNLSKPVLDFASALGADLGEAAALTGATLRAFNLEASQAARVTDVLTAAATKSATDFAFFNTALSTVAPVANAVNVSIETTTALLSTLANSGIDASTSATGLRNIFLALAESGQSLPDALNAILNSSDQASKALELFGKRGASLGVVLANNQEATADLNAELLNAAGTAEEVAEKQLASLEGQLDLLTSAWQGYILGAGDAGGISDKLKGIVGFLAKNLELILNIILSVGKAFVIYKVALFAATIATKIFTAASNNAQSASKRLIVTLRAIPFAQVAAALAALIPLVLDLIDSFVNAGDEAEELTFAQETLNKVAEQTAIKLDEERAELDNVFQALKDTTAGTEERQKALDVVNEKYDLTLQNLEDEAAFVLQVDAAYNQLIGTLEKKIKADIVIDELTNLNKQLRAAEGILAVAESLAEKDKDFRIGADISAEKLLPGEFQVNAANAQIQSIRDAIKALKDEIKDEDIFEGLFDPDILKEGGSKSKKALKKNFKTQAELNRQRLKDLQAVNKLNLKAVEGRLREAGATEEEIREGVARRRIVNLEAEQALALKLFGEFSDEFIDANLALNREIFKQNKDADKAEEDLLKKKEARLKRELALKKKNFKDIQDSNAENLRILEAQLLAANKSEGEIQRELDEQRIKGLEENAKKARDIFGDQSREFIDANLALQRELKKQNDAFAKEIDDAVKNIVKSIQDGLQVIDTFLQGQIDKLENRIAAEQKNIDASRDRVDSLKEEAAAGNLDAKKSIKLEEQRQAEAQEEIASLEKKKATLIAVTVGLKALGQAIDAGDQNAFANVGSKISTFIAGLSKFKEGTEDTGAGGSVDGDGGFLAVVHPHERIVPKNLNRSLGGMSNSDLVAAAMRGQDQLAMGNVTRRIGSFENINVLTALNGIKQGQKEVVGAIKGIDIPHQHIQYDEATKMFTESIISKNKIKKKTTRIGGPFS